VETFTPRCAEEAGDGVWHGELALSGDEAGGVADASTGQQVQLQEVQASSD
jgi:hypothetical protein